MEGPPGDVLSGVIAMHRATIEVGGVAEKLAVALRILSIITNDGIIHIRRSSTLLSTGLV